MSIYRVWAKVINYAYADIPAESEKEAIAKAEEMDGGEFISAPDGDWEIMADTEVISCMEVKND